MQIEDNQVQRAYDTILEMIYSYQFAPGSSISDFNISKLIGISRTSVRQAIMMLVSHGIVTKTDKGFKVIEINSKSIDDLYDARICLEVAILRVAMKKELDRTVMQQLGNEVKEENSDIFVALQHDMNFHRLLMSLCKNERLETLFDHLFIQTKILNVFSIATPNSEINRNNSEVYEAMCKNDVETSCKLLETSLENERSQKKETLAKFGEKGLVSLCNYIASSYEKTHSIKFQSK